MHLHALCPYPVMVGFYRVTLFLALVIGLSSAWQGRSRRKRAFPVQTIQKLGVTSQDELKSTTENTDAYEEFKGWVMPKLKADWMKKDIALVKYFNSGRKNRDGPTNFMDKVLTWRDENNVDGILKENMKENLALMGNAGIKGKDLAGRPILYINFGIWNIAEAIKNVTEHLHLKTMYYLGELAAVEGVKCAESGNQYSRVTAILDFEKWKKDYGSCPQCGTVLLMGIQALDEKYVNFWHRWVFINTPLDFNIFFDVVRVGITKETNEVIVVFGKQKSAWKRELYKLIDPKVLKSMMYDKEGYDKDYDYATPVIDAFKPPFGLSGGSDGANAKQSQKSAFQAPSFDAKSLCGFFCGN